MGTTRIKVIDLSSDKGEIKTSRKHAEKLAGVAKIKEEKKVKVEKEEKKIEKEVTKGTEDKLQAQKEQAEKTPSAPPVIKTKPKTVPPHHRGKKYQEAVSRIDKNKTYSAGELFELLPKTSTTKFDPTVELHLNITDKNIRGSVNLPHPIGPKKEMRYLVFSDQKGSVSDKNQGVIIIWGDEKTISDIQAGKLKPVKDFDQVYAQPIFMPKLAKIAKILGPKGLMPNPKNGTIIESDIKKFSQSLKTNSQNSLDYKTDPTAPIIHTKIGKLSTKPQELEENLKTLISTIGLNKIKKATVTTTMGPGIKLDLPKTLNLPA